jgi:hypothetical protein
VRRGSGGRNRDRQEQAVGCFYCGHSHIANLGSGDFPGQVPVCTWLSSLLFAPSLLPLPSFTNVGETVMSNFSPDREPGADLPPPYSPDVNPDMMAESSDVKGPTYYLLPVE